MLSHPYVLGKAYHEDLVAPGATETYLELCKLYAEWGSASMDRLTERRGLHRGTVHRHLCRLREVGLISWDPTKRGTLQPLYGRT